MLSWFKSNESKDHTIATERLAEDSKEGLLQSAAKWWQEINRYDSPYSKEISVGCLMNDLDTLRTKLTRSELDKGIPLADNWYYQRQSNGRFEFVTK